MPNLSQGSAHPQAHELSACCLTALACATQLSTLSLEGIPRMGPEGWRAVAGLSSLTRLAVRSRGDNAGLGQVRRLLFGPFKPPIHICSSLMPQLQCMHARVMLMQWKFVMMEPQHNL